MRLVFYFLFINTLTFAQSDSISPKWNKCAIDSLVGENGRLLEVVITQNVWSKSKKKVVMEFWERRFNPDAVVIFEYTGIKYYKSDQYDHYEGTMKTFNANGRRIKTKRVHYKKPSFI